jgi:hypothetical protein
MKAKKFLLLASFAFAGAIHGAPKLQTSRC